MGISNGAFCALTKPYSTRYDKWAILVSETNHSLIAAIFRMRLCHQRWMQQCRILLQSQCQLWTSARWEPRRQRGSCGCPEWSLILLKTLIHVELLKHGSIFYIILVAFEGFFKTWISEKFGDFSYESAWRNSIESERQYAALGTALWLSVAA